MRAKEWICLCSCLTTLCSAPLMAQTTDQELEEREAALFGEPEETTQEAAATPTDEASREDALFGDPDDSSSTPVKDTTSKELEIAEKLAQASERLAIGGFLFMRADYAIPESGDWESYRLRAPQLLDLYLDARPTDRVRAYARARYLYDFTIPAQQAQTLIPNQPTGNNLTQLAQGQQRDQVLLDQLWVKFDLARSLYVTVGRQRVRWGAGRFWNPTDFLNATQIDPLALFDQRLGVDMIKLHYPIESLGWNLYAVAILSDSQSIKDIGGALRAELVFGTNELSLSMAARRQTFQGPSALPPIYEPSLEWPKTTTPLRLGADFTGAIGPFDLRLEGALSRNLAQPFYRGELAIDDLSDLRFPEDYRRDDEWIAQGVAGLELGLKYSDQDSIIIAAEYFYNSAGYANSDLYLWTLLQGGFRPLYMGRHYAALGLVLPSPGTLDSMTFSGSALGNLSDGSFIARFDYTWAFRTALSFNFYAMQHFGNIGEFKLRVVVPPIPGNKQLAQGATLPAPSLDLGVGLRLTF